MMTLKDVKMTIGEETFDVKDFKMDIDVPKHDFDRNACMTQEFSKTMKIDKIDPKFLEKIKNMALSNSKKVYNTAIVTAKPTLEGLLVMPKEIQDRLKAGIDASISAIIEKLSKIAEHMGPVLDELQFNYMDLDGEVKQVKWKYLKCFDNLCLLTLSKNGGLKIDKIPLK